MPSAWIDLPKFAFLRSQAFRARSLVNELSAEMVG